MGTGPSNPLPQQKMTKEDEVLELLGKNAAGIPYPQLKQAVRGMSYTTIDSLRSKRAIVRRLGNMGGVPVFIYSLSP